MTQISYLVIFGDIWWYLGETWWSLAIFRWYLAIFGDIWRYLAGCVWLGNIYDTIIRGIIFVQYYEARHSNQPQLKCPFIPQTVKTVPDLFQRLKIDICVPNFHFPITSHTNVRMWCTEMETLVSSTYSSEGARKRAILFIYLMGLYTSGPFLPPTLLTPALINATQ